MGKSELIAGDVNKDGVAQSLDISYVIEKYGINQDDTEYKEIYDFNNDGEVQSLDLSWAIENFGKCRRINF